MGRSRRAAAGLVIVVDDLSGLDDDARDAASGARPRTALGSSRSATRTRSARSSPQGATLRRPAARRRQRDGCLVKRAIPSLPDRSTRHLLDRVQPRPGAPPLLREAPRGATRSPSTATRSTRSSTPRRDRSVPPSSRSREERSPSPRPCARHGSLRPRGSETLDGLRRPTDDAERRVHLAVARSPVSLLARGDAARLGERARRGREGSQRGGPHYFAPGRSPRARTFTPRR